MARLFIAIDLPSSVRTQVANVCFGVPGVRWVTEDQIHLTLRFVGEVGDPTYHDLREMLTTVDVAPFTLTLEGAGFFPPRKNPRVLWVGVEANPSLLSLASEIESVVQSAGLPAEQRKFHPHITVARLKPRAFTPERIIPWLQANALFRVADIPVTEFHLYSSLLKPQGAVHRLEQTYRLHD